MKFKVIVALLSASSVLSQEAKVDAAEPVEAVEEPQAETQELEEAPQDAPVVELEGESTEPEVAEVKQPFTNPMMESIGTFLMLALIALSNAGGLSGAGSNIPIMLIFFDMDMKEAVPVSAFVAVCATVFRFIFNFSKRHPTRKERNAINYEIVQLSMPSVFMGSFLGVLLGKAIGETWQMIVFGITVAWSI